MVTDSVGSIDPHEPPAVIPVPLPPDDRLGHGWWVEGGRLWLKDQASLPDVCVLGGPPGSPGRRTSVRIARKSGYQWLGVGLALAILLGQWLGASPRVMMLLIVGGNLAALRSKWAQASFFYSDQKRWSYRWGAHGRGLVGMGAFIYGLFMIPEGVLGLNWVEISPLLPALGLVVVGVAVTAPFGLRAVRKGEWFELRGVAPAAIQRLEEIQAEQRMPLAEPGQRPSPT